MNKDPNRKAYILVTLKLWNCETERVRKDMIRDIKQSIKEMGLYGAGCIKPTNTIEVKEKK